MPNVLAPGARTLAGRDMSGAIVRNESICPDCGHPSPLRCSNHPPIWGEPANTYICLSDPESCRRIEDCGFQGRGCTTDCKSGEFGNLHDPHCGIKEVGK